MTLRSVPQKENSVEWAIGKNGLELSVEGFNAFGICLIVEAFG